MWPRIGNWNQCSVDGDWRKVCALTELIRDTGLENAISVWLNFLTGLTMVTIVKIVGELKISIENVESVFCVCWEDVCI